MMNFFEIDLDKIDIHNSVIANSQLNIFVFVLPVLVSPLSKLPCRWRLSGTDRKLQTLSASAHATVKPVERECVKCGIRL